MGGRDLFDRQRVLTFRFEVVRDDEALSSWSHVWDRTTGDYRLEGVTRDGDPLVALFNVQSREGRVWLQGKELDADAAAPYLKFAYARFINDSYWLLMPWKWLDPGVDLAYAGTDTVNGEEVDVVKLSFNAGVGLTSNDVYWAYVSRSSGLMVQWAYLLEDEEGNPGTGDPTVYQWVDWEPVAAGVKFARRRVRVSEEVTMEIRFPLVETSLERDDSLFAPPPSE